MYHKFLLVLAGCVLLSATNVVIAQGETVIMPGDAALDQLLDTGPSTTNEQPTEPQQKTVPGLPKQLPKTGAEA